ncbi:calmodulin-like protein 4 isoform X1 [Sinocyclocheilus grahami]|uniref:calmodulin-like protein 4 isoform X1 n=1 Tax=Sinocyclocheilus grahami TaxID=75366 RepID=UPI0007AD3076|nr:PREDICTED: calmodulin-like protein 4 isoform X1 [Sinocyclocheilus grahami]
MLYNITTPFLLLKAKFLSQDQINEYKECFSLYDQKRRGKMKTQDLLTVMRTLGCCPTLQELDRHLLTHTIDKSGELDFSTFLSVMHAQIQQENPRAEILQAVRLMDTSKRGFITAAELRARLTGFGERLTDQEVDELLSEAGVTYDGQINDEGFAKMVTFLTG